MREILSELTAQIENDGRRQLDVAQHVHRVEATLRAVDERLYLLRTRFLCVDARLEALSGRLAAIEGEVSGLHGRRPPAQGDAREALPGPDEGCAQPA